MQNDEPYVFEKPLRGKSKQRSVLSKVTAFSALGISLFGLGAGNLLAVQAKSSDANSLAASSLDRLSSSDATNSTLTPQGGESSLEAAQITSVAKADPTIVLPVIATADFGNTSSATPYAGGGTYGEDEDEDGDEDGDEEDYDDGDPGEDD